MPKKLSKLKTAVDAALENLDMSKSARMKRAAEQGFDPTSRWYRGSASDEVAQSPGATFMAKDPNLANQYADQQGYTRDGSPNVAEMLTNASSPFDADALPRTITVDGFVNEILDQARARGEVDRTTMDRMFALRNKLK